MAGMEKLDAACDRLLEKMSQFCSAVAIWDAQSRGLTVVRAFPWGKENPAVPHLASGNTGTR